LCFFAFTSNALKKSKNKEKAMTALSTFRLKTTSCYDHKKEYVQNKKKSVLFVFTLCSFLWHTHSGTHYCLKLKKSLYASLESEATKQAFSD